MFKPSVPIFIAWQLALYLFDFNEYNVERVVIAMIYWYGLKEGIFLSRTYWALFYFHSYFSCKKSENLVHTFTESKTCVMYKDLEQHLF